MSQKSNEVQPSRRLSNSLELQAQHYPAPQGDDAPEPYETLQDLLAVLVRQRKFILLSVLVFVGLAVLACLFLTHQYTSTAVLEVNRDQSAAGNAPADAGSVPDDVKTEVETDTNILQSDALALEVIQNLHLEKARPFSKVHVKEEQGLPLDQAPRTRDAYLHLFAKSLKVASVPDSRLIQISFKSPDPVVAANVANTLSEVFIADSLKRRFESTTAVSYWISKEIEGLRERVQSSEQKLADYEHKTGLAGIDLQPAQTGNGATTQAHVAVIDRLNTLNQERTAAEASRISSEAVYRLTQSQDPETVLGLGAMNTLGGGSVLSQGGGLDLLRTLRSQEVNLKSQYADISTRFGAQNPQIVQLKSQIGAMDGEIHTEMARIQKRAENDFRYAQQSEDAIDTELKKQQHLADQYTDETVQLQLLAQEAFSNRSLYQNLYSELNQANVAAGIHATRLNIVDRALVSGAPTFPNNFLFVAVALAGGIFVGIIGAFVLHSNDQTVRVPKDVESTAHLPVLSQLPALFDEKHAAMASREMNLIESPRSLFSESFHVLCTAVVSMFNVNAASRSLLITSPLAGDGKSTVAFNLAIALAQRGERVLLIDGDMRHPVQHALFGSGELAGLSDALRTSQIRLSERTIRHSVLTNLSLLSAGGHTELPAELFSSVAFDQLLAEARANFRWIIIDSPPVLPFTDATIIAGKVDGVLTVLRSGVTSREVLKNYTALLHRMHAPLLGFVLNCVNDKTRLALYSASYDSAQKVVNHA